MTKQKNLVTYSVVLQQIEETDESNEEYKLETQTEKERIGPTLERPDGEGNGNSSNNGYNGSDADLLNPDNSPTWQEKESVKEQKKAIEDDFEEKQV